MKNEIKQKNKLKILDKMKDTKEKTDEYKINKNKENKNDEKIIIINKTKKKHGY